MTVKEFDLLYAIQKKGMQETAFLASLTGLSEEEIKTLLETFKASDYVNDKGITEAGLAALSPYKVDNAVIMAAGMSSRFMPLSLEKPKGLLTVKGEILIERQIKQLRAAGIEKIVIVLGYKHEEFLYLGEKYGVELVINPEYNTKNNTHTVYLAQKHLGNTYICSSDNYFSENVFRDYVYDSYYSAIHVNEKTNEWYMYPDENGCVARVEKSGEEGDIMLGHVFWSRAFSNAFTELVNLHHAIGDYDDKLWEDLFADHIPTLPPMHIKVYPYDVICEFDSLEELRQFDKTYVDHSGSAIMEAICKTLSCEEHEIVNIKPIKDPKIGGTFSFEVRGKVYGYTYSDGAEDSISALN